MKRALALLLVVSISSSALADPPPSPEPFGDHSKPGLDSLRQPGVPSGKEFSFKFSTSKVFPGTSRNVSVYVPAQYKGEKPACMYVALDGLGFDAPVVFDNLINKGEMPVTIGIGISPGQVDSAEGPLGKLGTAQADPRFNRSLEFDGLDDSLARLVLDEVLPEVEQHKTPDGLPILLSKDPNDRCTAGGSTGAIAAFTLAWERPDAFHRVFTAIGTFVGMRGGDRYPVLVRKTEPKPIRIFMQDGANDEWGGGPEVGDWWMGNQTLERALEFSGYQVEHSWGTGTHNGAHATAIFPDAMRFLWKDWPQPVKAGETQNNFLKNILLPDQGWEKVSGEHGSPEVLAADPHGEVFYVDGPSTTIHKVSEDLAPGHEGAPTRAAARGGFAFGPDGQIFACNGGDDISTAQNGDFVQHCPVDQLVVTHPGLMYGTELGMNPNSGKLWLVTPKGEKKVLDAGLDHPTGVAVSPDGLWLAVLEQTSHWGYSYRIASDGSVDAKQRFYWLHVPDTADNSGAKSICFDNAGWLYAATRMGVQVLDRNGRTRAILPVPGGEATGICFGGEKFDTLFVSSGGRLYQRKLKSAGTPPGAAPIKLPPWGAG